jgi:hypothetical protein
MHTECDVMINNICKVFSEVCLSLIEFFEHLDKPCESAGLAMAKKVGMLDIIALNDETP